MHTPVLWSYITDFDSCERSRQVPLHAYLVEPTYHSIGAHISPQIRRIGDLRVFQATTGFLNSLEGEATGLETLSLAPIQDDYGTVDSDGPLIQPFDDWKLPSLRTLAVQWFVGWHTATFPSLTHFILEKCLIESSIFRGLHALLSTSPYLEDIVFSRISVHDNHEASVMTSLMDTLSPIGLPCLQRIVLKEAAVITQLIQKKVNPNRICAKEIKQGVQGSRLISSTELVHSTLPVAKLCFDRLHIVGTDGRASFRVVVRWDGLVTFYERFINRPQDHLVRELWFLGHPNALKVDMNPNAASALQSIQGVTKAVVVSIRSQDYLINLSRYNELFPHLAELQLQNIPRLREEALMELLQKRAAPLATLRFVHYGETTDTLPHWRSLEHTLRQFANSVVFEKYNDLSCAPRMELPDICTTPSTVHGYWLPWETAY